MTMACGELRPCALLVTATRRSAREALRKTIGTVDWQGSLVTGALR
jgi:hypothetical protein